MNHLQTSVSNIRHQTSKVKNLIRIFQTSFKLFAYSWRGNCNSSYFEHNRSLSASQKTITLGKELVEWNRLIDLIEFELEILVYVVLFKLNSWVRSFPTSFWDVPFSLLMFCKSREKWRKNLEEKHIFYFVERTTSYLMGNHPTLYRPLPYYVVEFLVMKSTITILILLLYSQKEYAVFFLGRIL